MNTKYLVIIFFIFCCFQNSYCLSEKDSSVVSEDDKGLSNRDEVKRNGIDLIAISGLGMTTGSTWGEWETHSSIGPAIAMGLEIPFTSANYFSLEIYSHFWISKIKKESFDYSDLKQHIRINKDYYSRILLLVGIKFHILNINKSGDFKLSGNIDYVFFPTVRFYFNSFNFCIGLNYKYNEKLSLYLTRRIMLTMPPIGGSIEEFIPNLLTLNVCYKFNLALR